MTTCRVRELVVGVGEGLEGGVSLSIDLDTVVDREGLSHQEALNEEQVSQSRTRRWYPYFGTRRMPCLQGKKSHLSHRRIQE